MKFLYLILLLVLMDLAVISYQLQLILGKIK
jgi:hypothetical protein